jgi:hypothetical protein
MKNLNFPKGLEINVIFGIYPFVCKVIKLFEFQNEVFAIVKHKSKNGVFVHCVHVKTGRKFGEQEKKAEICMEKQIAFLQQLPEVSLQKAIAKWHERNSLKFLEEI